MTEPVNKRGNKSADIIVIGAGMVGAAAALGLAQQGLNIILVEARLPQNDFNPDVIDNRVSALTRASEKLLNSMGVWDSMQAMRAKPYTDMHVWDAEGKGLIHFDAAELAEPSLGHIVENQVTQLALWHAITEMQNIEIICPDKVMDVDRTNGLSLVSLESGKQITAELVVVADGKQSATRDLLGIKTRGWLYDQHAVVATVVVDESHNDTAWQRFMPEGPLAFLPLAVGNKDTCSIVWSTSPEKAESLVAMSDTDFCQSLGEASEFKLGNIISVEKRGVFPLELKHAQSYIREGYVLIGDAAHAVHPLAGQGVNLGFLDVQALQEIICNAQEQGRNLGGMRVLRQYERDRKASNMTMLAAMDGFKRLFSNRILPLVAVRNAGLSFVNNLGALKHFFVRYAMGLDQLRP